jgi:hypothetical protein
MHSITSTTTQTTVFIKETPQTLPLNELDIPVRLEMSTSRLNICLVARYVHTKEDWRNTNSFP